MNTFEATDVDRQWLINAIELARKCPPSSTAFSVGAIVVAGDGNELVSGYSRETDMKVHAEESALSKVENLSLRQATLYSTLEPCSFRKSRPRTCTELILAAGIPRVVIAWREPDLFVADCQGVEILRQHGVEVVEVPELAELASSVGMPAST
ncbi:dCMP deaminase [Nonomuraea angiospora]|uniref:dCMP deaminase n=1 Tax=Nonomuraea angiospora TaxID=46172 RepID=UPI0034163807